MQIKLLQVLQEKTFYRVGGESEIKSDVRIIAATNSDLKQLTDTGEFRSVFKLGLVTQLTKVLSWQVEFTNHYLSNPPVDVKTTDVIVTTGLRLTFGRPL